MKIFSTLTLGLILCSAPVSGQPVYDLPLSANQQEFIYQECQEYDLSYELVLGVINAESTFNPKTKSDSSHGLMQLNSNTYPTLAKELGLGPVDVHHIESNVQMGIYYLDKLRDYWVREGYTDEDALNLMLISYNRGISGCKRYIAKNGLTNRYVDKVLDYKYQLEGGEKDGK